MGTVPLTLFASKLLHKSTKIDVGNMRVYVLASCFYSFAAGCTNAHPLSTPLLVHFVFSFSSSGLVCGQGTPPETLIATAIGFPTTETGETAATLAPSTATALPGVLLLFSCNFSLN